MHRSNEQAIGHVQRAVDLSNYQIRRILKVGLVAALLIIVGSGTIVWGKILRRRDLIALGIFAMGLGCAALMFGVCRFKNPDLAAVQGDLNELAILRKQRLENLNHAVQFAETSNERTSQLGEMLDRRGKGTDL